MRPQSGRTTVILTGLVGKLRLRAREVVKAITAVLTLRQPGDFVSDANHPRPQGGLLPYGLLSLGGGRESPGGGVVPRPLPPLPSTRPGGRAWTYPRPSTAFLGSRSREVRGDGRQYHSVPMGN